MTDFKSFLNSTTRATAFDIMSAIDKSIAAPSTGSQVIVASPIGDCHHISRWVVSCGATQLGYSVQLLGEIDAVSLANKIQTMPNVTIILTWLLTPSQTQLLAYLNNLGRLPHPPRLILGGLTVSKAWISEISPNYTGDLTGAHAALDLLRSLA